MEILIIQTAFVGDLLLSIPLLKQVRLLHPSANLVLLCRSGLGDFMRSSKLVDEVIELNKADSKSWSDTKAKLKKKRWDWIISPHQSLRTHVLVWFLSAKRKTGYKNAWNFLIFNDRLERPMDMPEALRQLALIANESSALDETIIEFAASQAHSEISPELTQVPPLASMELENFTQVRADYLLRARISNVSQKVRDLMNLTEASDTHYAVLAPGSVWNTKMWSKEGFAKVGQRLSQKGYEVLVIGSPSELAIGEMVTGLIPGAKNLVGRTSLWESAEVIALSDYIICNDSGAMHMASLASVPTVAVFGPTTLNLGYRPWQNFAQVVQLDLTCRPCGKHGSQQCPLGTHACMKNLSAEMVLAKIR